MKYPIGIQNFEKIRREGYAYVDKTAFPEHAVCVLEILLGFYVDVERLRPAFYLRSSPAVQDRHQLPDRHQAD